MIRRLVESREWELLHIARRRKLPGVEQAAIVLLREGIARELRRIAEAK